MENVFPYCCIISTYFLRNIFFILLVYAKMDQTKGAWMAELVLFHGTFFLCSYLQRSIVEYECGVYLQHIAGADYNTGSGRSVMSGFVSVFGFLFFFLKPPHPVNSYPIPEVTSTKPEVVILWQTLRKKCIQFTKEILFLKRRW